MTIDYAEIRRDADEAIRDAGAAAILRVPGPATGPEWDPTPGVPVNYPIFMVLTEYNAIERDGTLIQVNDRKALVSAEGLAVEPSTGHQIIFASKTYEVVSSMAIAPAGVSVMFEVQIRG